MSRPGAMELHHALPSRSHSAPEILLRRLSHPLRRSSIIAVPHHRNSPILESNLARQPPRLHQLGSAALLAPDRREFLSFVRRFYATPARNRPFLCLFEPVKNAPMIPSTRHIIRSLQLNSSSMFASWLLDAVCPFNVSYLTHIDVVSSMEPGVASILTGAQLTLQALTVTPFDVNDFSPLRLLPALAELTLSTPVESGTSSLLPLLETLDPTNCLSTPIISIAGFAAAQHTRELLEDSESAWSISHWGRCNNPAPNEDGAFWNARKISYADALARTARSTARLLTVPRVLTGDATLNFGSEVEVIVL
ncbi:hypothetical protein B0H13DRAFT_1905477 [Mycena leptocephala]|nr:hypothetical protein B0H13DRAFT_1905477 [Mycena leptocephala]